MVSASSQQGKAVMEHEAQVMLAANQHSCSHVIPLITPAPCVDGKQQHYSFVTTLLPYDLFKWRNQQTSRVKLQHCYPVVARAVYDGLKCLHASGYIHWDLKDDNILFKDFDADGCPSGIVLGDLGLAQQIGSSIYKFAASNYAGSSHLVASLFDGQSDPLGINTMVRVRGTYVNGAIVQAKIDYCSWAMMVTYIFGLPEDKDLTKMLGKGSCGPMGPGRRKLYPWETDRRARVNCRKKGWPFEWKMWKIRLWKTRCCMKYHGGSSPLKAYQIPSKFHRNPYVPCLNPLCSMADSCLCCATEAFHRIQRASSFGRGAAGKWGPEMGEDWGHNMSTCIKKQHNFTHHIYIHMHNMYILICVYIYTYIHIYIL